MYLHKIGRKNEPHGYAQCHLAVFSPFLEWIFINPKYNNDSLNIKNRGQSYHL